MKVYLVWDYYPDANLEDVVSIHQTYEAAKEAADLLGKHDREGHYYSVVARELSP